MTRYWDYAESERAKLSMEQVEKLLAYELMEKGVLQVEPLALEEEKAVALPARRVFVLHEGSSGVMRSLGLGFDTVEDAEAAVEAIKYIVESPWNGAAHTRAIRTIRVVAEDLPTEEDVAKARVPLDEQQRREQSNSRAKREHEEAEKKVADATSVIWSDWHACREQEARHQKIRDTFADYARMTEGKEDLARAFLAKAFPADEIDAAMPAGA